MSKIYFKKKGIYLLPIIFLIPVMIGYLWLHFLVAPKQEIPEIQLGIHNCSHCGMMISDIRFASVIVINEKKKGSHVHFYDDHGCLLRDIKSFGDVEFKGRVHDIQTAQAVPLKEARFVKTDQQTPMGSGWVTYAPLGPPNKESLSFKEALNHQ